MFDAIKSESYINSQESGLSSSKSVLAEAGSLAEIGQIQSGLPGQSLPIEEPADISAFLQSSVLESLQSKLLTSQVGALVANEFDLKDLAKPGSRLLQALEKGKDALLTGGQNTVAIDAKFEAAWEQAIATLTTAAPETEAQLQAALGEQWTAQNITQVIIDGISELKLERLPVETLQAKGAFAAETQTIYLADDWASTQSLEAVVDVLLEEVGHFVDDQFGKTFGTADTAGDEGAIFSALLQGKPLTPAALADLQAENDQGTITLGQQVIDVERASLDQASLDSAVGTFTANNTGEVLIDYTFDGGSYKGELAVFSLEDMGGLETDAFVQEAARRALSGGTNGQIVVSDKTQGAQFSGELGERDFNEGETASTQVVKFAPNTKFAFMFVVNGTILDAANGQEEALFSIAEHNPDGEVYLGQAADGIFGMEDLKRGEGDDDFNDIVFEVKGATAEVTDIKELFAAGKNWLNEADAQAFLTPSTISGELTPETPTSFAPEAPANQDTDKNQDIDKPILKIPEEKPADEKPILEKPVEEELIIKTPTDQKRDETPTTEKPSEQEKAPVVVAKPPVEEKKEEPVVVAKPPVEEKKEEPVVAKPAVEEKEEEPVVIVKPVEEEEEEKKTPVVQPTTPSGGFNSDISTTVAKFDASFSEAEIIKRGANSVKIGTQTIYIGTQQVSPINQNPIIRSYDPVNPKNNWVRTDIETTGTDGRGLGLVWTGKALYAVFSVDGTQGTPSQDFRRATGGTTQSWLKSYGSGGGTKIAVLGQIDPSSGTLLKAAHLSAVLSSGKTNALSVKGITVNGAGNLVVKAQSFSNPRRPDGKPLTKNAGNTASGPFDYTLEITSDLSKVVRTSAPGWS
ncbi:MAG: DUF4114 domain-containing protein [Cyanobacteria bacterium J06634_5]